MTAVPAKKRQEAPAAPLAEALAYLEEVATELDANAAHACAGWDCATCTPSSKAATIRDSIDTIRREMGNG